MIDKFNSGLAIVTGGASGLGKATASKLAEAGLTVVVFDLNEQQGKDCAETLKGEFIKVDVSDAESVSSAMQQIQGMGNLRVLVNCAGIASGAKTVSRGLPHDTSLFEKTIAVNLVGSFNCASQGAALMAASEPVDEDGTRGVIISSASIAAFDGQVGQVAYAASKGGIVAMTLPMARDLADKGIRVCAIAPGLFLTPLLDGLPEEVQVSLGQQVPFPARLGNADEFAKLALSIIDNPMLNGEVIRLDGALRMAPR